MALDIIARGMAADSIKCISQDLTEEQKAIARNNIGASGGSEDLKNAVQVIPQNFTEAQKQQARDNIGAVSVSSFDAAEADIVDLFAETAALGQKTPSASQGSFIINEMTRSNSLSIDPTTGGYGFNVIPSGGVSEATAMWSVSNEITFEKGTISTPGEYTFCSSFVGSMYFKLTPGKSYVMYIKYIRGTIPANLENWAFTFSSGGKTVSMNLNNTLPVEVFVPVAGDLAFGGRFTPNEAADPSITFDEVNKYTIQILMVEVNNGSNQGIIIHKNDLATIENQIGDMAGWADVVGPKLDSLEANTVQVNSQTFTEEQKTQARTNIGAASQTSLDNNIANCVQIKAQSLTDNQKTQARTNINAACATYGAIGNGATATTGGAVGTASKETNGGGAVGRGASATQGGAIGNASKETSGGGAVGGSASATAGGAIGFFASATYGGAVGNYASATSGGAVGQDANATIGGAIGDNAKAGVGFSGGSKAKAGTDSDGNYIDAIQLGTGTNNTPKTLQVYTHKVYDSTKDSLYGSYLNDKTPAVIETVWSGTLTNDGSTTITVSNYSQYDYFILYGNVGGRFCNIISNINGTYGFTKKAETSSSIMVYSFGYADGSFIWSDAGYYESGNFTFVDRTGTSFYNLYKIEGVKICKA